MNDTTRVPDSERMAATLAAQAYQKANQQKFREEVIAGGAPYVIADAVTPHEIFHALDVPVISLPWYSAIIAAKHPPVTSILLLGSTVQKSQPADPFVRTDAVHASTHAPSPQPWSWLHCSTIFSSPSHPSRTCLRSREQWIPHCGDAST